MVRASRATAQQVVAAEPLSEHAIVVGLVLFR